MENLCDSANNGCEGTYDVLYLPTNCLVVNRFLANLGRILLVIVTSMLCVDTIQPLMCQRRQRPNLCPIVMRAHNYSGLGNCPTPCELDAVP